MNIKQNKILISFVLSAIFFVSPVFAQNSMKDKMISHNVLNHLDFGVNLGTTGVGLELSTTCTDYLRLRAGVDYMPRFGAVIDFGLQSYQEGSGVTSSNFDRMQEMMTMISGYEVDQIVNVEGKPTALNFKFMVDVYPWADKGWHLTAGFFAGGSRIAKAVNVIEEMPSLLAVGMYNKMYDRSVSDEFLYKPIYGDNYLDPDVADKLKEKFLSMGRVGIHMGDYADGTPYMMEPGRDGLVRADVLVNKFKPYLGVGYNGALRGNKRVEIGFDLGAMMWGGSPKVLTHDGVDLANDVTNVRGKVGTYVDVISAFKVYPVVNFRIAYKIF